MENYAIDKSKGPPESGLKNFVFVPKNKLPTEFFFVFVSTLISILLCLVASF